MSVVGMILAETDIGIIKGATNLELRIGTQNSRVSSDLDAVRRSTLSDFSGGLQTALEAGWAGFAGRLVDRGPIPAPLPPDYMPHRFKVKLEYLGRPFRTIEVEVSAAEVAALEDSELLEPSRDVARWFEALGLPEVAPIAVLSLRHQIVQKLHACTTPDEPDWINDRAHDLIDLQLLVGEFKGRASELKEVADRLFTSRGRHAWPPLATVRAGWSDLYKSQAEDLPVLPDAAAAVDFVNYLIAAIEEDDDALLDRCREQDSVN